MSYLSLLLVNYYICLDFYKIFHCNICFCRQVELITFPTSDDVMLKGKGVSRWEFRVPSV